jgi:hypothetical protein
VRVLVPTSAYRPRASRLTARAGGDRGAIEQAAGAEPSERLAGRLASSGLASPIWACVVRAFEDVFLALTSHPGRETLRAARVGRIRAKIPATSCSRLRGCRGRRRSPCFPFR